MGLCTLRLVYSAGFQLATMLGCRALAWTVHTACRAEAQGKARRGILPQAPIQPPFIKRRKSQKLSLQAKDKLAKDKCGTVIIYHPAQRGCWELSWPVTQG